MGLTLSGLIGRAKALAQDGGPNSASVGLQLLLTDPDDYQLGARQALRILDQDRPNTRIVDVVVPADGFLFPLTGASRLLPLNPSTPAAPSATLASPAAPGNVTTGTHSYRVAVRTAFGSTAASAASSAITIVAAGVNGQVDVALPALPTEATAWDVYRTVAGNTGNHLLVGTQLRAAGPIFRDTVADGSLGAIAPTSSTALDPDAWIDGASSVSEIWWPYADQDQGQIPNDTNGWRLRTGPGAVRLLEFLGDAPAAGDIVRVVFTSPHVVVEDAAISTPLDGDSDALDLLTASLILQLAAVKMAQNTGNTGLPNDIVDRRTQSDVMRTRSKELRAMYDALVGAGVALDEGPASGFKDLDITAASGRGYLWHPSSTH